MSAERVGLDEFWIGDEGPAREPFAILATAAGRTSTIRLGVGVTNPYTRVPGLTAATAMTLHELSNGRFTLGVGAGGQLSLGPFGLEADAPMHNVERLIRAARAARSGVDGPGYSSQTHAVAGRDDLGEPAIYVGARGPLLNTLASREADGVFIAGMPPFRFGGAIDAARSVHDVSVALYPGVAFHAESLDRQRPQMIWGLLDAPQEVRARFGLDADEISAAANALVNGNPKPAMDLVTDELASELILIGEPDAVGRDLADLATRHRPASIGLALIDHRGLADLDRCVDTFRAMRQHLEDA